MSARALKAPTINTKTTRRTGSRKLRDLGGCALGASDSRGAAGSDAAGFFSATATGGVTGAAVLEAEDGEGAAGESAGDGTTAGGEEGEGATSDAASTACALV